MAREYPEYPIPSCHALIRRGDHILLIQRGRPPFEGHWGLPGGGVELGELVTEALIREVREETGLEVEVNHYLGYADAIQRDQTGRVRWHYIISYFEVEVIAGELQPADDAVAARWVTPSEARAMQTTDAVERCLTWSRL